MKKLCLFAIALCCSTAMFADGGIFEAWVSYGINDEAVATHQITPEDVNLETINKFQVENFYVKVWQDNDAEGFSEVNVFYQIDEKEVQTVKLAWSKNIGDKDREWAGELKKDLAAGLEDGDHVLSVWVNGKIAGNEVWWSNDNKNFKFNFTIGEVVPVETKWFIAGGFNDWQNGMQELTGEDPEKLSLTIELKADSIVPLKLVRVRTQDEKNDTTWFGVDADDHFYFGHSEGFWFFEGQGNVNLEPTKVGEYTFFVNPLHKDDKGKLAPIVSVMMPEPSIDWFIMGSFNDWKEGFALTGEDYTALTATIKVEAKTNYEFKVMRTIGKDSTWFGLGSAGNVMRYGHCTDWVAYKSAGEDNQHNVGLLTTKEGDYVFTVDVMNKVDEQIAPKFSVAIPEPEPDPRTKREIVFVPGEAKASNPTMMVHAFTIGKEPFSAVMSVKKEGEDTVCYVAEIPDELDSLILVRAKDGLSSWEDLVWDGEGRNVWNQTEDLSIDCDTAVFSEWVLETPYFTILWCGKEPEPKPIIGDQYYIKVPVPNDPEGLWEWHLMEKAADAELWQYATTWQDGGANISTGIEDNLPNKYFSEEDIDFGENLVKPAVNTECTYIWNPEKQSLAVDYEKEEGIENVMLNLSAPMYDVLGRQVTEDYHGIIIQNGRKFVR